MGRSRIFKILFALAFVQRGHALAQALPTPDPTDITINVHRLWVRSLNKSIYLGTSLEAEYVKVDATDKATNEHAVILSDMSPKPSVWFIKTFRNNSRLNFTYSIATNAYLPDSNSGNNIITTDDMRSEYSMKYQVLHYGRFATEYGVGRKSVPYVRVTDVSNVIVDMNESTFLSFAFHFVPINFESSGVFLNTEYQYVLDGENKSADYEYEAGSSLDLTLGYQLVFHARSIIGYLTYSVAQQEYEYATQVQNSLSAGLSFTTSFE